jgi:hypothetical protein
MEFNDLQNFFLGITSMLFFTFVFTEPLRRIGVESEKKERMAQEAYQNKLQQRRFLLDCL